MHLLFEEKTQARGRGDPGTGPMSLPVHPPAVGGVGCGGRPWGQGL